MFTYRSLTNIRWLQLLMYLLLAVLAYTNEDYIGTVLFVSMGVGIFLYIKISTLDTLRSRALRLLEGGKLND